MNLYPIKHQQKHHISEKTCPPMIDLIYNNLMNVNNKSDHEAVQGEGRGYPRPIEIPLYHKCKYLSVSFKQEAGFIFITSRIFLVEIDCTCGCFFFKSSCIYLYAQFLTTLKVS